MATVVVGAAKKCYALWRHFCTIHPMGAMGAVHACIGFAFMANGYRVLSQKEHGKKYMFVPTVIRPDNPRVNRIKKTSGLD